VSAVVAVAYCPLLPADTSLDHFRSTSEILNAVSTPVLTKWSACACGASPPPKRWRPALKPRLPMEHGAWRSAVGAVVPLVCGALRRHGLSTTHALGCVFWRQVLAPGEPGGGEPPALRSAVPVDT